jgi:hypothetical protein
LLANQSSAISIDRATRLRQADFDMHLWSAGIGGGLRDRKLNHRLNVFQERFFCLPVFAHAKMQQSMVIVVFDFITTARVKIRRAYALGVLV